VRVHNEGVDIYKFKIMMVTYLVMKFDSEHAIFRRYAIMLNFRSWMARNQEVGGCFQC
jgi:hypothetical protein